MMVHPSYNKSLIRPCKQCLRMSVRTRFTCWRYGSRKSHCLPNKLRTDFWARSTGARTNWRGSLSESAKQHYFSNEDLACRHNQICFILAFYLYFDLFSKTSKKCSTTLLTKKKKWLMILMILTKDTTRGHFASLFASLFASPFVAAVFFSPNVFFLLTNKSDMECVSGATSSTLQLE